jgi:hypothetical protein
VVSDGSVECSAAINAAFAKAIRLNLPLECRGRYKCSSPLIWNRSCGGLYGAHGYSTSFEFTSDTIPGLIIGRTASTFGDTTGSNENFIYKASGEIGNSRVVGPGGAETRDPYASLNGRTRIIAGVTISCLQYGTLKNVTVENYRCGLDSVDNTYHFRWEQCVALNCVGGYYIRRGGENGNDLQFENCAFQACKQFGWHVVPGAGKIDIDKGGGNVVPPAGTSVATQDETGNVTWGWAREPNEPTQGVEVASVRVRTSSATAG